MNAWMRTAAIGLIAAVFAATASADEPAKDAPAQPARAAQTLNVYFIGNSLTMSLTLDRVHALCALRGVNLQFGSQLSGGKSLIRHLRYKQEPDQKWHSWETNVPRGETFGPDVNHWNSAHPIRFGLYDRALVEHKWDALVMQPYLSSLHDDLLAIGSFVDLALKHESAKRFYLYSTWPRRQNAEPRHIDFSAVWQGQYTAAADDTSRAATTGVASRSYLKALVKNLDERYPKLQDSLRVIPVGEVLFQIDQRMKRGELKGIADLAKRNPKAVPGFGDRGLADGVNVLYADAIHLNPMPHKTPTLGIFISGTTVHTVLTGQSPVGLSAAAYALDDPKDAELIKELQQIIWDVVTAEPRTGLKAK